MPYCTPPVPEQIDPAALLERRRAEDARLLADLAAWRERALRAEARLDALGEESPSAAAVPAPGGRVYLNVKEAAAEFPFGENTFYRWCRDGVLPSFRTGKEITMRRADIEAHLDRLAAERAGWDGTPPAHVSGAG